MSETIGVIGAGTMGNGIAQTAASNGFDVVMCDVSQEMVDRGHMNARQAATSRHRNVITRALGIAQDVAVDVAHHPIAPGDVFMLCTDGLTDVVTDKELDRVMTGLGSAERQVLALEDLASARSARDDATVLVARFGEMGPDPGGRRRSR